MAKKAEVEDNLLYVLIRAVVTGVKALIRFIGLGIIFADDVRNYAVKNFDVIRKANNESLDDLVSAKKNRKEYERIKSRMMEL
jgi:hypothetical protein